MSHSVASRSQWVGHLACFATYTIFGFNMVFCKDIANDSGVPPIVLFALRAGCASALFWLLSLFLPRERMARRDLWLVCLASLLGLFVPQLTFLTSIGLATPVDLSVLSAVTPIMTMFVAAVFLKEPITWKKAGGVALSFCGVLLLILQSTHHGGATETQPLGILLSLLNSASFALYLGIFRPLIARYNVVTFMKWMFLFSFVCSLPFAGPKVGDVCFDALTPKVLWEIGFLVFFATFVAYFLIPVGQKRLRPTLVSMYGYLQPIIATAISIQVGMDRLSWPKVLAAAMVFGGVALVNRSRAAAPPSTASVAPAAPAVEGEAPARPPAE